MYCLHLYKTILNTHTIQKSTKSGNYLNLKTSIFGTEMIEYCHNINLFSALTGDVLNSIIYAILNAK